jgi:dipeptidyl aminopeptidase/acylaminoacyl peptidase
MWFFILCLLGLLLVFPAAAQDDIPRPTGQIAFTSQRDGEIYQIYVMYTDGSNIRQLTNATTNSYLPIWSPDGQKIAFTRVIEEEEEDESGYPPLALWVMDANGENAVEIARDDEKAFITNIADWLSWSPDSKRFLYRRYLQDEKRIEAILVNADGTNAQALAVDGVDLNRVHFLTNDALVMTDYMREGEHVLRYDLADGTLTPLAQYGNPIMASWDSTQLALIDGRSLLVMDLKTLKSQTVWKTLAGVLPDEEAEIVYSLDWSPDGSRLAGVIGARPPYRADATPSPTISPMRDLLFAASADGTEYAAFEAADRIVSLSPDGEYIVYSVQDAAGDYAIAIARSDGEGSPIIIADEGQPSQPAWRPVR